MSAEESARKDARVMEKVWPTFEAVSPNIAEAMELAKEFLADKGRL